MDRDSEYTLSEAAIRLAFLKGREKPYSRQYMSKLCREGKLNYYKAGQDGNLFLTTEKNLLQLLEDIKPVGRPQKIVDM